MYNEYRLFWEVLKLNRFELVSKEELAVMTHVKDWHAVLKDTFTGVHYYFITNLSGKGTLTPLLDADGKPLVDKSK